MEHIKNSQQKFGNVSADTDIFLNIFSAWWYTFFFKGNIASYFWALGFIQNML